MYLTIGFDAHRVWHVWVHTAETDDVSTSSESFIIGIGLTPREAVECAQRVLRNAHTLLDKFVGTWEPVANIDANI